MNGLARPNCSFPRSAYRGPSGAEASMNENRQPASDLNARDVLDNLFEGCQIIGPDYRYV